MIKKVLKIKNIGRFNNYNSRSEELAFDENTLIFGENTNGKSTFTAILRSLKTGDSSYLQTRKTFGVSNDIEVEILVEGEVKKYNAGSWRDENIEIFDNEFIKNNVFDSDNIGDEQMAGLYGILVGDANREKSNNIKQLKDEQRILERDRDEIKNKNFKESISIEDFLKLEEIVDIDTKIDEKEKEIKQQQNLTRIKDALEKTFLKNDITDFMEYFKKTIDIGVEKLITDHIKNTWSDTTHSDAFLGEGVNLLKENNVKCVFCGQNFITEHSQKLIEAFKQKFSKEYNDLKNAIKIKGDSFLNLDFEKEKLIFQQLGVDICVSEALNNSKREIDKKIIEKQQDLNLLVDFEKDSNFQTFKKEFEKIKEEILELERKISIPTDIMVLKSELDGLKVIKKRFSKETLGWVKQYNEKDDKIKSKVKEIQKKSKELVDGVNEIFDKNEDNINSFLEKLDADFRIHNFRPVEDKRRRNLHYCEYSFIFDKYNIERDKFKTTFSDSDKRLLAFAMFLSKLKNDNDLKNKIIVLDDPFSSFDNNRREKTINCLRDIKNSLNEEPKQKIILTHEESFLVKTYKKLNNVKVLKIHKDISGSKLEFVDIENDFIKDIYFKDLEYIKKSIDNVENLNEALKKTRPCLEHVLKRKYYFYIKNDTLKKGSINGYVEDIGDGNLNFDKQELYDLNLHQDMHDSTYVINSLSTDTEKVNRLKDFLNFIGKV